jgi:hypothetical protein
MGIEFPGVPQPQPLPEKEDLNKLIDDMYSGNDNAEQYDIVSHKSSKKKQLHLGVPHKKKSA